MWHIHRLIVFESDSHRMTVLLYNTPPHTCKSSLALLTFFISKMFNKVAQIPIWIFSLITVVEQRVKDCC